jgi:hypothetical protein
MSNQLLETILAGGIQHSAFFNGRLLTAEAMQAEQTAQRRQDERLGQAIGAGVVAGMDVVLAAAGANGGEARVDISPGLAINPRGQTLAVPPDVSVVLVQPLAAPATGGDFVDCGGDGPLTLPTGTSIYILLAAPAWDYQGRAPQSGLGGDGQITGCGNRWLVDGMLFRLIKFDPTAVPGISADTCADLVALMNRTDAAGVHLLRNRLAHLCLGTEDLAGARRGWFAPVTGTPFTPPYGALDALRAPDDPGGCSGPALQATTRRITGCDVPLALIYWTANGIRFVDNWAVRRRPAPAQSLSWDVLIGARRSREAEALLLQFQDQLAVLRALPKPKLVAARDHLRYLPPVGILPLAGPGTGGPPGFTANAFFAGLTCRDVFLNGARLEPLIRAALAYPPVDLTSKELIWRYHVRENTLAQPESGAPPPYLVFASGHVPYMGESHLDVLHANYGYFW